MRKLIERADLRLISEALAKKQISATELVCAYIERIQSLDGGICAYLETCFASAVKDAEQIDAKRISGKELTPLAGIPYAIKDNISTKGIKTTCASKILESYIPPYNATVVERLSTGGAILLGKVNMDEFAMGSATDTSAFKITKNPLDPSRVAGGSSGGSAAAVAARMAAFALGSDTGGSVRQPATFCGAVGIKPTYGTVSRYGLVAFAPSLEQIAPITADVYSNALVLGMLAGRDERDATTHDREYNFTRDIQKGVNGLRLGIDTQLLMGATEDVRSSIFAAIEKLRKMGARIVEVSLPDADAMLAAYYVISSAEASSNLARFDGVRYGHRAEGAADIDALFTKSRTEGFGDEVKRRIMLGTYFLNHTGRDAYYKKALATQKRMREEFDRILRVCDAVISPVAPTVAYRPEDKKPSPLSVWREDVYTVIANVTGLPAISMPCGKGEGGMPVGIQLMGRAFDEATLYRICYAFEQEGKNE